MSIMALPLLADLPVLSYPWRLVSSIKWESSYQQVILHFHLFFLVKLRMT